MSRLFFLTFFSSVLLFAQQKEQIDSLNSLYETYKNKDLIKASNHAEASLYLSEKSKDDLKKLASYKNYIEVLYKQRKNELAYELANNRT